MLTNFGAMSMMFSDVCVTKALDSDLSPSSAGSVPTAQFMLLLSPGCVPGRVHFSLRVKIFLSGCPPLAMSSVMFRRVSQVLVHACVRCVFGPDCLRRRTPPPPPR